MSEEGGRLIIRGAQATTVGLGARLAARLLFLFVAARLFGPSAFGAYVLAVAAVELAVGIGGLGTKKTLFQILDRHDVNGRPAAHALLDAALLVAVASLLLGGLIAAIAVSLPADTLAPATARALLLVAPMAAGQALLDLFLAATRWKHAIRYEVIARSVVEPWALLAGLVAAWLAGWRLEGLILGYWCGTLAALAYALWGARRCFGGFRSLAYRPRRAGFAAALNGAASNTGTDFLNALYGRADLYLVGLMLGESAAGIYGMARQLALPLRQVRQSFDGLLIPLVARTLHERGAEPSGPALASATRLILIVQLPLLLTLCIIGRPLLEWLGPAFVAGFWALIALALAETVQAAFSVGDLMFAFLRPQLALRLTAASILVGLIAAFLLIPPLGVTGAGLSVLIAYWLRALLRGVELRTKFAFGVSRAYYAGPVVAALAGAAAGAGTALVADAPLALAAGLGAYGAALLLWLRLCDVSLALSGFSVSSAARE